MSEFRYPMIVPTIFNVGKPENEGMDINISLAMVEECLRDGIAKYKGSDFGVPGFTINYAKAKAELDSKDYTRQRHFFIESFNAKYHELCEMWQDGNFPGMCMTVAVEMRKREANESPEARERWERLKKEIQELAEKWKAEKQ